MLAQSPVQRVSQSCFAGVRNKTQLCLIDASDRQVSCGPGVGLFLVCVDTLAAFWLNFVLRT